MEKYHENLPIMVHIGRVVSDQAVSARHIANSSPVRFSYPSAQVKFALLLNVVESTVAVTLASVDGWPQPIMY